MIYESMFHSLPIHQEERKLSIGFSKKVKKWLTILTTSILYMLQVKIKLILFFFCLLALIILELRARRQRNSRINLA